MRSGHFPGNPFHRLRQWARRLHLMRRGRFTAKTRDRTGEPLDKYAHSFPAKSGHGKRDQFFQNSPEKNRGNPGNEREWKQPGVSGSDHIVSEQIQRGAHVAIGQAFRLPVTGRIPLDATEHNARVFTHSARDERSSKIELVDVLFVKDKRRPEENVVALDGHRSQATGLE